MQYPLLAFNRHARHPWLALALDSPVEIGCLRIACAPWPMMLRRRLARLVALSIRVLYKPYIVPL